MLDRIEIFGFRRILHADVYVGRKTVAFVGPNEAGKTSILSALRLFESDDPVPASDVTRSQRGQKLEESRVVVRLSMTLDESQRTLANALPIRGGSLRYLTFAKLASGAREIRLDPAPSLDPKVFDDLKAAWPALYRGLSSAYEEIDEGEIVSFTPADLDTMATFAAGDGRQKPALEVWESVRSGINDHLKDETSLGKELGAFQTYYEWARPGASLGSLVYQGIGGTMPVFVQFTDNLRSIRSEYVIADAAIDSDPALSNLLRLAQLPITQIRESLGEPDHLRTIEDRANARLRTFFEEKWKQEKVTVGIRVSDEFLRVDVQDLADDSSGWIKITERSDGLRTFVALAAFLESGGFERPPILLIDEAEQHLHQNAQGDLIRMLQDLSAVQQVIYTTHSPACLPADLGNGVRFVEPIAGGHSRVRHDFWSIDRSEHVGFNPLMIVMGAGAAAFSTLRSALVAEGVSDMLLLPTLIKIAIGQPELTYQVSPGIATASKTDMTKLDYVASRVAYLVDGDTAGKTWRTQLEAADVPRARIRALPEGLGLEDLLERKFYLDSLAELGEMDRGGLEKAAAGLPIKSAVERLKLTPSPPGPVAFAEFILGKHESGQSLIVLEPSRKRILRDLNTWVLKTLSLES
jgi:hypothetical protein